MLKNLFVKESKTLAEFFLWGICVQKIEQITFKKMQQILNLHT